MLDIGYLNNILEDFTDNEKKYLSDLTYLSYTDEESIKDKSDKRITIGYRNFLYNILKYRNLKLESEGTRAKRLIKACRYVDLNTLERDNYDIIRFSAVYLATDVIFLNSEVYHKYFRSPAKYSTAESLNIPSDVCLRSMHLITDCNNNSMTVALLKNDISEKYLTTYNSWDFPIF